MQSSGLPQLAPLELPAVPRFLPDLRLALAVLYSLPLPDQQQQVPTQAQAHDFLIHIQSRNAQRKIRSVQQKHRDIQNKQQQHHHQIPENNSSATTSNEVAPVGSSWLACLVILCQVHAHDPNSFVASTTERLFAAQTLLHRLRRVPVTDAVDIEIEQQQSHWNVSSSHATVSYGMWMRHIHPAIAAVLDAYHHHHHHHQQQQSSSSEEHVKAELTLLTLATVAFYIAAENHNLVSPLLSTTLSAVTTAALKRRYSADTISATGDNTTTTNNNKAVVTLVRQAFGIVWTQLAPLHGPDAYSYIQTCLYVCLGAIPDTVLGNPGGARGRLSMDPRLVQSAIQDLRIVELPLLWDIIVEQQQSAADQIWVLRTCERWARFLPLPTEMVLHTIPHICNFWVVPEHQRAALSYLLTLVEGASWTVEQVMSSFLGLSESSLRNQQVLKKRQTSRSKKRHKEMIDQQTSDETRLQAEEEVRHRGDMACRAVLLAWDHLSAGAREEITASSADGRPADGEGQVGCLAASANACLPHILRFPDTPHGPELFRAIAEVFYLICSSPNKTIRALSLEPLYSLHSALIDVVRIRGSLDEQVEPIVVEHFVQCALSLASFCGYPPNYFTNLIASSDEDLEIERNDIREVLRSVAGSGEGGSTSEAVSTHRPLRVSSRILSKILHSCNDAFSTAIGQAQVLPEAVVHAFSSLAKPLNFLAKFSSSQGGGDSQIEEILDLATTMLYRICESTINAFEHRSPIAEILPLSRIVDITIASLSPTVAARCHFLTGQENSSSRANLAKLFHVVFEVSILSIERLPELAGEATLGHAMYDIRGTMRGPGGEDHVGCLSLMRISNESPALTLAVVDTVIQFMPRLYKLHQLLKTAEHERGLGVFHGKGVTPQSRRILLGVLCHLELASHGRAGASSTLEELFQNAVVTIATCGGRNSFDETTLAQMVESTFDLASFSPTIVSSLFSDPEPKKIACLEALTTAIILGYQHLSSGHFTEGILQWNRLRAAMFQLLRVAANADIPDRTVKILHACIVAECEAIQRQCREGPESSSSLFNDDVVSPDSVPAGVLVKLVADKLLGESNELRPNFVRALVESKDCVIGAITLSCQAPQSTAFVDPRPTLAEAWFHAMVELSKGRTLDSASELLLVDSCVAAIYLLFFPSIEKSEADRRNNIGMCLDGPHSLVMTTFLAHFFQLGPTALCSLAHKLTTIIPIHVESIQESLSSPSSHGATILGAALFRAAQGAAPPWAIESIPEVYSSLYFALGRDPSQFGLFLRLSMEVRLSSEGSFGGVQPGQLLSGPYFRGMSETVKNDFVNQATELCRKDDLASWKRLKFIVKQVCGGKKKESDFRQKPSLTQWEFSRL